MFVLHYEKEKCKGLEFWGNYDRSKPGLVEEFYAFYAFYPAAICNLAISKNSERNKLFCNNFILLLLHKTDPLATNDKRREKDKHTFHETERFLNTCKHRYCF